MSFNLQQQRVDAFTVKIMVVCLLGAIALISCFKKNSVFRSASIVDDKYIESEYSNDFSYGFSNDKGSFEIGIGWEVLEGYVSRGFSPPPISPSEISEVNQCNGFKGRSESSDRLSENLSRKYST